MSLWRRLWPAVLLSGCMVGPDYHRPSAPLSQNFKELPGWKLATPQDAAPKGVWWAAFADPTLDRLEAQVARGNQSVAEQLAAYDNARALIDEARAALFPTVTGTAGVTRSSGGATSGGFGGSAARTQYSLEGSADWEIDVWGAIRRQVQSDVANAQASAATLANVLLSEQALLATDYLDLRVTDALQRVLDETVRNDTISLNITQNQYAAGVAARSDVLTAQAQLDAARSAAINVGVARAQYEHALAVLVGQPPATLALPAISAVPAVPDIPGVLPSVLLERRPDVSAAERTMKAQNALIGVAVAAYYPTITL